MGLQIKQEISINVENLQFNYIFCCTFYLSINNLYFSITHHKICVMFCERVKNCAALKLQLSKTENVRRVFFFVSLYVEFIFGINYSTH